MGFAAELVERAELAEWTLLACPADAVGCTDVGVAGGSWVPVAIVIFATLMVLVAVLAFRRR
jgi:hypothetical protein